MTSLDVLVHGEHAGTVADDRAGRAIFAYTDEYLSDLRSTPLSVSIPLQPGPHYAESWLDGLLADNDNVRQRWAADYGIFSTRPIDLLSTPIGRDCAGAVQFCLPSDTKTVISRGETLKPLDNQRIADIIAGLRVDSAGWNQDRFDSAFSLGGAQSKTALRFDNGQWYLPEGNACTTHILKPTTGRFPDLDIVEHVCQRTAHNLGIQAAQTESVYFDDERTLIVTRYDRLRLDDGTWRRIHQEDLCQALAIPPARKYQRTGGPSPPDISTLIRLQSSDPEEDIRHFLDGLIYNWIIANPDAHAKNYGLLIDGQALRLAPLYDLCSFLPYRELQRSIHMPKIKLAMKIGGEYALKRADLYSAWQKAAEELQIPEIEVVDRIEDLARRTPDALEGAIDSLPLPAQESVYLKELHNDLTLRAKKCAGIPSHRPTSAHNKPFSEPRSEQPSPVTTQQLAVTRFQRCPHYGVRSKVQCNQRIGHRPPHRYT